MAYTVGVAAMLVAFWATPATLAWAQWATVFMIGFFLYGPQMLIGLCGAELVGPESVGASEVRHMLAVLPSRIQCLHVCTWYQMQHGDAHGTRCNMVTQTEAVPVFVGLPGLGGVPWRSQRRRTAVNHRQELRLECVSLLQSHPEMGPSLHSSMWRSMECSPVCWDFNITLLSGPFIDDADQGNTAVQVLRVADFRLWCGAASAGADGEPQKLRTEGGCQEGQTAIASRTVEHRVLVPTLHAAA